MHQSVRRSPRASGLLFVLLTALIAFLAPPMARASDCQNEQQVERDSFQHFDPATRRVTLDSGVYQTGNVTEFRDLNGNRVPLEYFQPGMVVETRFCPSNNPANAPMLLRLRHRGNNQPPPPPPGPAAFGVITDIQDHIIMVNDHRPFDVRPETDIVGANGEELTFAALTLGRLVEVYADDPGLLAVVPIAERIVVFGEVPPQVRPFSGNITAIDTDHGYITVGGMLRLLAHTGSQFFDVQTGPIEFLDLRVGDNVFGLYQDVYGEDWNSLLIINRTSNSPGPGVELVGLIDEINHADLTLQMGESHIQATTDTMVFDTDFSPISFGDLAVADYVEVRGFERDGTIHARAIRKLDPNAVPVSFRGEVTAVDAASLSFSTADEDVQTTTTTEFVKAGQPATFADIAVGNTVFVRGWRQADGSVLAGFVLIENPNPPPDDRPISITGAINDIDDDETEFDVAGHEVIVTPTTEIFGPNGNPITFSALRVGMVVHVVGFLEGDDNNHNDRPHVIARRIQVVGSNGCVESVIDGRLNITFEGEWILNFVRVRLSDRTSFSDADGNPLTAEDFHKDDIIVVRGCRFPDGVIDAFHVRKIREDVPPPPPNGCNPTIALAGPVTGVIPDQNSIIVEQRRIMVTNSTQIYRAGVGMITLADITTNDNAFVSGKPAPNSSTAVVACEIRVQVRLSEIPPSNNHLLGRIHDIYNDEMQLIVGTQRVQVTTGTLILTREGEEIGFTDLQVGNLVFATGNYRENLFVAARIRVQEENHTPHPRPFVAGPLTAVTAPWSITVGDRVIALSNSTFIQNFDLSPLSGEDLTVGMFVVVRLAQSDDPANEPVADIVRVRAAAIEEINAEELTFRVSGINVSVVASTHLREQDGTAIEFSDLAIGDLVAVRLRILDSNQSVAALVVRLSGATTSQAVDGFSATEFEVNGGALELKSSDPMNTFGFVSLPTDSNVALPNTLYEVTMKVATDVADPGQIPTARLRLNMEDYEKGASLVIDSNATRSLVPTAGGREYRSYFMPSVETDATDAVENFFPSLDLLSFESRFAQQSNLRLEGVSVKPVDASRIRVAQTLLRDEFTNGTNGWYLGGAEGAFTMPRFGAEGGVLTLASSDNNTFGFWTKDTDVDAVPGKLYRARFLLSTNWPNANEIPEVRVRLNGSTYEFASVVNVASTGDARETLRTDARVYDAYLYVPADAAAGAKINASVDILNFDSTKAVDATVTLEQFLLEEIVIE